MIDKETRRIMLLCAVFSCSIYTAEGYICERETGLFSLTERFTCPGPGQPDTHKWCCGDDRNRYCCEGVLSDKEIEQLFQHLPTIIGIIAASVLVVIVLCIVCCCCCPFCFMYKRRNRGAIHQPSNDATMQPLQTQQAYPNQQGGYPAQQPAPYQTQAPYPTQAQPYPQQQPYPPQQGYPAQQPYPAQQGYPPQQQPYPGTDYPPPYSEKQAAFNPNYAQ